MNESKEGKRRLFSLRAPVVFPLDAPPIENGCITIQEDRIVAVEKHSASTPPSRDLGDVAVLPGLINAHAHLELSDLDAPLGRPGMPLGEWLDEVVRHQRLPRSITAAVERGLDQSTRLGATLVADISRESPSPDLLSPTRPELLSFLELIAPTPDRVARQVELAENHLALGSEARGWLPGLSPHAPYSVAPDLLVRVVALSAERHVPLAMHLAESREELELIRDRRGPLCEWLKRLGVWDEALIPVGMTIRAYLETLSAAYRALIIHGNYLADEDIAFLAARAERMAVVYCPRTHRFFRHQPYPLEKMLTAGVRLALGTDSRASSPDLSVLAEMREVRQTHPSVSAETIARMATLDAAVALGQQHRLGSIAPGKQADLTVVDLPSQACGRRRKAYDGLLESDAPVVAAWRAGREMTAE